MTPERPAESSQPERSRALRIAVGVWTAAVAFTGPLVAYILLIHPLRSAEVDAAQVRSAELQTRIRQCGIIERFGLTHHLDVKQSLVHELAELEWILPSHPPTTQALDVLRRYATSAKVRLIRLEPERPVLAGNVGALPWRAEMTGSFGELNALIEHLDRSSLIIHVTELHLVRLRDGTYRLRLGIDTFFSGTPGP